MGSFELIASHWLLKVIYYLVSTHTHAHTTTHTHAHTSTHAHARMHIHALMSHPHTAHTHIFMLMYTHD